MTQEPAKYCPDCGTLVSKRTFENRSRQYCTNCEQYVWQNAVPCVATLVQGEHTILLIKRSNPPKAGSWAMPGGALEADEPPEVGASRELKEETNLDVDPEDLILHDTKHRPSGTAYIISIGYVVNRAKTSGVVDANTDADDARFWTIEELKNSENKIRDTRRIWRAIQQ